MHSVSAIGEQYLDLVSTGNPGQYFSDGQTITEATVPSEVGPALDAANRGLAVLPKEKIDSLLTETSKAVGGLGPALQRLVDGTTNLAQGFQENLPQVNDIIANSAPILDSQVQSGDAIEQWSRNLNTLAAQSAAEDQASAQRSAAGCAHAGCRLPSCSAMSASPCRRRWRTWRSSSTCSSATTRASSRRL